MPQIELLWITSLRHSRWQMVDGFLKAMNLSLFINTIYQLLVQRGLGTLHSDTTGNLPEPTLGNGKRKRGAFIFFRPKPHPSSPELRKRAGNVKPQPCAFRDAKDHVFGAEKFLKNTRLLVFGNTITG